MQLLGKAVIIYRQIVNFVLNNSELIIASLKIGFNMRWRDKQCTVRSLVRVSEHKDRATMPFFEEENKSKQTRKDK